MNILQHMINLIATILFCLFTVDSGNQTVLSAAERFFYRNDFQQAAEMIDGFEWSDQILWSKAGFLRELCDEGWSFDCPVMPQGNFLPFNTSVRISLSGEFQPGDSVRVVIPVPSALPWQTPEISPEISVAGIAGTLTISNGWFELTGVSEGAFEIGFSQDVAVVPPSFNVSAMSSIEEAMVPFPGEDLFLDSCLDTEVFWAGDDPVYMKASVLAANEPNPVRLLERVMEEVSVFYSSAAPLTEQILLYPLSELALQGEIMNSASAASLGAAVLRRWQIPSIAVPGRMAGSGDIGFLLAAYVKPFGWMVISPYPSGFTALGSIDPPIMRGWFNGISGITFQAESQAGNGLWYSVHVNSHSFSHTVQIDIR